MVERHGTDPIDAREDLKDARLTQQKATAPVTQKELRAIRADILSAGEQFTNKPVPSSTDNDMNDEKGYEQAHRR